MIKIQIVFMGRYPVCGLDFVSQQRKTLLQGGKTLDNTCYRY
jgi:hypothetical protein